MENKSLMIQAKDEADVWRRVVVERRGGRGGMGGVAWVVGNRLSDVCWE